MTSESRIASLENLFVLVSDKVMAQRKLALDQHIKGIGGHLVHKLDMNNVLSRAAERD